MYRGEKNEGNYSGMEQRTRSDESNKFQTTKSRGRSKVVGAPLGRNFLYIHVRS
jgi:hypothetical protein